jgi:hypothetical protein
MQIRQTDREAHAGQIRRGVELADGFAFDPAFGRSDKAHLGFSDCVHRCGLSELAREERERTQSAASVWRVRVSCAWRA